MSNTSGEPTRRFRRPPRGARLAALAIATVVVTFVAREASADGWTPTSTAGAPSARSVHTAVWTGSKMIVWGGFSGGAVNTGGIYESATDTWTATSTVGAPSARVDHTGVWTGSKMIVWGGNCGNQLNTGGIYDPTTDTWAAVSTIGAPSGRCLHTAVWTGTKMIVWGGLGNGLGINTGGIYDPTTDTWTAMSTVGAPSARHSHTAVWTGSRMIVWGGGFLSNYSNTGGIYDPTTDTWTAVSTAGTPSARQLHTAVWTGSTMIVWGGYGAGSSTGFRDTGAIYDPTADTWTALSTVGAPAARDYHTAVWTGSKMFVWGGYNGTSYFNTGGIYDPPTDTWTAVSTIGAPSARPSHTAVWIGSKMIVWGGGAISSPLNTGGIYDPSDVATTTVLVSSLNPSMVGESVTFTATVIASSGTPSGTVTFNDGATTLGTGTLSSGTAALATSSLSVGAHSIKAVYGGDASFLPSWSTLTQTVRTTTTTVVTSSLNPSTTGQGVTFTATVTSSAGTPTGSVAFLDGSLPLGTYALSGGVASTPSLTSLAVGSHLIVANYLGAPGFLTSSSDLTQVVFGDNAGISTSSASIAEGNSGTKNLAFIVSLSTAIAQTVTVQVATQDGTATAGSDYAATSSTLTFNPGVTSQFFLVPITGDTLDEPDETFFLTLSNPVNATLATTQAMGVILHDDSGTNPSTLDQVFTPVAPCRFVDSLAANDKVPAAANSTTARYYRVRGSTSSDFTSQGASASAPSGCGVPDSATAVMVNLTVADPTNDGDIRVDASHFATPSQTSLLNYTFGGARFKNLANGVIVPLCNRSVSSCASGANPTSPIRDILVTFHAGASAVSTYFLADVLGYFSPAPVTNLATIGCGSGTVFAELAAAQCPAGASRGTPECGQVAAAFPCAFGTTACSGATVYRNDGTTLSAFSAGLDNCAGTTDWYIRLK
jgi:N-acetylneuraminic acid mutarotase